MGKMITVKEACRELGIARSTLERRMKRLGIATKVVGLDRREHYITDKELNTLRTSYAAIDERNRVQQTRRLTTMQLEDKVKALEDELERLKQLRTDKERL